MILKNNTSFENLAYWDRWDLFSHLESFPDKQLFTFVFTNYMIRIESTVTVTVFLELQEKTEATIIIFATGGKSNSWGAHEHCENKLFKSIKKESYDDWIIKEITSE